MASTILSDNGVSSGSAGIKTTADSTGALALQTTTAGGAATTALTISTAQVVTCTGELQARVPVASNGIVVNSQSVATSYTIATGYSGTSAGPITIASGQAVTVSSGSRWVVL